MTKAIKDRIEEEVPDKVKWLDKHSEASMVLFNIFYEIEAIARAFKVTGNSAMCTTLMAIAADIEKARKDMSDAIGESISEDIKRSDESTKAILEAALAGILMERTNPTIKGKEK